MKNSRISILFISLLAFVATGFVFDCIGHAAKSSAQDTEKSLDIERHAEEPLELVDIKVSEQSVTSKIEVKRRRGGEGLDYVKFRDKDEWFKRVSVRMRNISGKPIIGVRAYLYFKPRDSQMLFRVDLASSTQLKLGLIEPNAEVDLTVFEPRWKLTANILASYGVDADQASISFSVDNITFSDGLQWDRGRLLRRDPNNPNTWIPVGNVSAGDSLPLARVLQISIFYYRKALTSKGYKHINTLPRSLTASSVDPSNKRSSSVLVLLNRIG